MRTFYRRLVGDLSVANPGATRARGKVEARLARSWRMNAISRITFLVPAVALIAVFFLGPIGYLLKSSLYPNGVTTPSFFYYRKFLGDTFYLGVLWRTVRLSLIATIVALLPGYALAYTITFLTSGRLRSLVTACTLVPLVVNLVIRVYGWVTILSPRGALNSLLLTLGMIQSPKQFLYTEAAIVIGLVHSHLPFMVLSITSALMKIDPILLRASQNLGAGPFRTFSHVILPMSLPGIVAGSLLVFTLNVSAFVVPNLLGGSRNRVMTYLIYQEQLFLANDSFAAAETVILLIVTSLAITGYLRATARYSRGLAS